MNAEEFVKQLEQIGKDIKKGRPHESHEVFDFMNSDEALLNDKSVHLAVLEFMVRVGDPSKNYLSRSHNLTTNARFHEQLALELESADMYVDLKLIEAVSTNDLLHSDRVQEALAGLIRRISDMPNLGGYLRGGSSDLSRTLAYIVATNSLRNNPEILKAVAEHFAKWEDPSWLFQSFDQIQQSKEILSHPFFIDAYARFISDIDDISRIPSYGRRIFDYPELIPVMAEKIVTMRNPIRLIEKVWQFKIGKDQAIQKAIVDSADAVAKQLRESSNSYSVIRRILLVSILLNQKVVQDTIISIAQVFIDQILEENSSEDPDEWGWGPTHEDIQSLPFLVFSQAFKTEYRKNPRFKKIMDILRPEYTEQY